MKPNSSTKKIIIIVVACIVLVLLYFYFEGKNSPTGSSLLVTGNEGSVGTAELSLLNQISSLKIDTDIFTDQVYLSLKDYSVPIPTQNVGRPNPFAPIPGVGTVVKVPGR